MVGLGLGLGLVVGLGSYGEYVITLGGELLQERPLDLDFIRLNLKIRV